MSDPAAPTVTKKRKSDASTTGTAKKARSSAANAHAYAQALVTSILINTTGCPIPDGEAAVRSAFVALASYARSLEGAKAPKSPEQVAAAAEKLRSAAVSGIKKQMTWKPACKTGSAKWAYDGVCNDPEVFGAMLNLGGPPTFKMKKISIGEFQEALGHIETSVRYDYLNLSGADVTIRWHPDEGTFKFSGTYGK